MSVWQSHSCHLPPTTKFSPRYSNSPMVSIESQSQNANADALYPILDSVHGMIVGKAKNKSFGSFVCLCDNDGPVYSDFSATLFIEAHEELRFVLSQ